MHIPFLDQWGIILIIGLLLFGKRLPEVGRSIGKGIVEFKKGLQGIEEDVNQAAPPPPPPTRQALPPTQNISASTYKFDPETGKPLQPKATIPPGAKFDPFTGERLTTESQEEETVSSGSDSDRR
jgi:sec-independent protein translocase protein TatA